VSKSKYVLALALAATLAVPAVAKPVKHSQKTAEKAVEKAPAQPYVIHLSHQLDGDNAKRLAVVVDQFNQGQKGYKVELVSLGDTTKPAQLNLATRAQAFHFSAQKGAFKPVFQVMKDAKEPLDVKLIASDLKGAEFGTVAKPMALPVAFWTPVLFYNKGLFRKAGLDPEKPPRTWFEMQLAADRLNDAGVDCPYTTSWPAWIHIDNTSALAGVPVAGPKGELVFNGLPQVKHVAMLATWYKAGFFRYFGARDEADQHFYKGECAMLTSNSWEQSKLRDAPGVELGVAPLPYHDDIYGGRQHTLADGAALWVGAGYSKQDYQGAAKFIRFLLAPDMQLQLARVGGFLPLTQTARTALKSNLLKDEEQTLEVAYESLKGAGGSDPLRISSSDGVRAIVDEELADVWADKKPAKAALDSAVMRGNALLNAQPVLKKGVPF
jgi:sn-glycerol 3-phosphate transport system substrate-binding protein